jgi:asparagine synthase (glutamine-hydrolysing)
MIAAEYDQPFGNASAVPTHYCAKLAREHGITRMLGGDGGDELFGGNARYARQQIFALYDRIPAGLRHSLIEPIARSALARRLPLVRKGASYVEQAREPMPARYESYNLLERMGPENIFAPDFLSAINRDRPLSRMAQVWDEAHAGTLINQMLALDLKYTLADNDLPKVTRMCDRAGVDVAFPLLDQSVVDFSARLAPSLKLRRGQLRYFFKKALQDFLPDEIIRKTKHGFGLPAGPWIASDSRLRSLAGDALQSLGKRGIVRAGFLDDLVGSRLREHAGYYGTMVWILVMLELWFARHVDPR